MKYDLGWLNSSEFERGYWRLKGVEVVERDLEDSQRLHPGQVERQYFDDYCPKRLEILLRKW